MDAQIVKELTQGLPDLLPGDRHHLQHNLMCLLNKSVAFKKAWIVNVSSAKQRRLRIIQHNNKLIARSRAASTLIKWMQTKQI